jgi:CheY-like chemotaxis protein
VILYYRVARRARAILHRKAGEPHTVTDEPKTTRVALQHGAAIKILHIEDDPSVGRALARLLRLYGYEVMSAASGDEAIQLVEDGLIPDLILTDYYLPREITGDQVVIEITTRLGFKPPTILLASAPDIAASVADRVFSKPADRGAVIREMEQLTGRRP